MVNRRNKTTSIAIKEPLLPRNGFTKGQGLENLEDLEKYTQLILEQADLSQQEAAHVGFDQTLFQHVQLHDTHLKKALILDSRLTACDLANAEWPEASLQRLELLDCHLTGFSAIEALLQDVLFRGCRGSFIQFRFSTLTSIRFESCHLSGIDFQQAKLTNVSFVDCDLSGANLSGARLTNVDLRGSKIDDMQASVQELKGATLDPSQALAFVRGLGIKVE